jgi:hypothetical protein
LRDSPQRRGLPLRERLREGGIVGQHQESNGRWHIHAVPLRSKKRARPLSKTMPPRSGVKRQL